jgi:ribosome-associated heat shock protein Hsp15
MEDKAWVAGTSSPTVECVELTENRQRIDKWLWHARVVRTRSSAAALVTEGHVRLNGERVNASSRPVRAGDVVTVALDRVVRILKVTGFAERRGDADAARLLCEDITPISPPHETEAAPAERDPGTGRPTKQERRATDRLLDRER